MRNALLASMLVLGVMLAACGGNSSDPQPDPTDPSPAPTGVVRGTILTSAGDPVAGAQVTLSQLDASPTSLSTQAAVSQTDSLGRFGIDVSMDGSYSLTLVEGPIGVHTTLDVSESGGVLTAPELNLTATDLGAITGHAIYPDGSDAVNVLVFLEGTSFLALTDAAGGFAIRGVPASSYTLVAKEGNFLSSGRSVTVSSGDTTTLTGDVELVESSVGPIISNMTPSGFLAVSNLSDLPIGSSVTIQGSGFGPNQNNSLVYYAGQLLATTSVESWSDEEIVVKWIPQVSEFAADQHWMYEVATEEGFAVSDPLLYFTLDAISNHEASGTVKIGASTRTGSYGEVAPAVPTSYSTDKGALSDTEVLTGAGGFAEVELTPADMLPHFVTVSSGGVSRLVSAVCCFNSDLATTEYVPGYASQFSGTVQTSFPASAAVANASGFDLVVSRYDAGTATTTLVATEPFTTNASGSFSVPLTLPEIGVDQSYQAGLKYGGYIVASFGSLTANVNPLSDPQPNPLALSESVGSTASEVISFQNISTADIDFSITTSQAWLSATPASGTVAAGATQEVTMSTACTSDVSDSATVTLSDPFGNSTLTVERTCGTASSVVTASPQTSYLNSEVNTTPTSELILTNSNSIETSFALQNLPTWLSANPNSGTIAAGGTTTVSLTATCPSSRTVQQGAFEVSSTAGTTALDVFQVCANLPANAYNIDIRFFGDGFDVTALEAFLDAAENWERVITNDLEDVASLTTNSGDCSGPGFPNEPALNGVAIDDLLIYAGVSAIDGEFNIVGSAGPCFVRSSTSSNPLLPTYGTAFFDSADVSRLQTSGVFATVVLHEIGHVIGMGTLWGSGLFNLIEWTGDGSTCRTSSTFSVGPNYTGAAGIAAYENLSGSAQSSVPLEQEGGSGTKCGHWDEGTFDTELLTGFVDGVGDPLSQLTGESLKDLGYVTDASAYDAYSIPTCSPLCTDLIETQAFQHLEEVLLLPRFAVSPSGMVTRIGEPQQ